MTMKSTRILRGLAAACCLALVATGCSSKPAAEAPQAVTPDIKATLNLWTYEPQTGSSFIDAVDQTETFKKAYPNVDVKITFIPEAQFANKVIASATTRTGPDILWVNGAYTEEYASAKVLAPLDPYWSTYADASQYPPSVIGSFDNQKYSLQTYVNLNALWYNKSILDEYKLPVPTSLSELESDMATISSGGKYSGLQLAGTTGVEGEWISKPFFSSFGLKSYKDYGDPKTTEMFTTLTDWVAKGYVTKANVGMSQTDGVSEFKKGKTAFYVGGNWQLAQAAKVPFTLGVTGMPSGSGGPGTVYLGGQAEAMGAFSTNKDLAWKFLEQTWLTKEFELKRLKQGSIPARKDALPDDVDPDVKAYASELDTGVALSPDTASTLAVGNLWSGVLAGQTTPAEAAVIGAQIAKSAK